jgi:phospholipid/cholesterol/gamma-HCH transport system substrate-binding protein
METKANHLIIGGFVLLVVAAGFGFVYWIEVFMNGGSSKRYDVIFNGSVRGLGEASAVLFNGLRVGSVKKLRVVPEDTRKVRAEIAVARDTPVRENSIAYIAPQGLAGMVALEISPGTPNSPLLAARPGERLPVIRAGSGGGGVMGGGGGVPAVLDNANVLFGRLNELVSANSDLVHRTAQNVESFTAMLNANKEDVAALIRDARGLSERFGALAGKLDTTMTQFSTAVSGDSDSIVAQAQLAAQSFHKLAIKLDKSVGDKASALTRQAQRSLKEFELFMKDGRRLAENLDRMLQKVENNPSSLIFGGSQVPEYRPGQQ